MYVYSTGGCTYQSIRDADRVYFDLPISKYRTAPFFFLRSKTRINKNKKAKTAAGHVFDTRGRPLPNFFLRVLITCIIMYKTRKSHSKISFERLFLQRARRSPRRSGRAPARGRTGRELTRCHRAPARQGALQPLLPPFPRSCDPAGRARALRRRRGAGEARRDSSGNSCGSARGAHAPGRARSRVRTVWDATERSEAAGAARGAIAPDVLRGGRAAGRHARAAAGGAALLRRSD